MENTILIIMGIILIVAIYLLIRAIKNDLIYSWEVLITHNGQDYTYTSELEPIIRDKTITVWVEDTNESLTLPYDSLVIKEIEED